MKSQLSTLIALAVVSGIGLPAIAADTKSSYDQLKVQSGQTKAAASDIFRAAPAGAALSEKQRTMLDLAKTSRATTGVKVVAGPTAQMLDEGLTKSSAPSGSAKITLALSDNTIVTAARTHVDVGPDASIWRGTVEHSGGQVTLMWWPDGQIAGTVQHEGHFYSIRPMGDGMHAIVDMSQDQMPPDHAPLMLVSSDDLFGKPRVASSLMPVTGGMRLLSAERHEIQTATRQPRPLSAPTTDVTIDVLVAYTKKAASYYSDFRRELVDLAIEEANESFRRSNVSHVKLRLGHRFLRDHSGIVLFRGARRLAIDQHGGARPHCHARAAATALLVAHDIPPLGAIDVAVTVGERGHYLVHVEVMARPDDMSDFMRYRVGRGRALMMHHGICFIRIGMHASGQPTALRIIHYKDYDIGAVLVAQGMYFLQVAVTLVR